MSSPPNLSDYRAKRDFAATPEPKGARTRAMPPTPRFVVQQHHATRLHWDLRLEHEGTLASWAVPNGIPPEPAVNRLAVRTEDHPLEYLEFEGEIPSGQYGAGSVRVWDRGTFEMHEWRPEKVEVTFHGERLRGRYGLFATARGRGSESNWMIHRIDPPEDPARVPMPERLVPMLATPSTRLPDDEANWAFEVKWDGVRAIAYAQPGRLRLQSRNLNDITAAYPEVRGLLDDLGMREAVLDGELIAFDDSDPAHPRPSFERLQRRMHASTDAAVRRLMASIPVTYVIFDLLYLDGRLLLERPYQERREQLERLNLNGPAWRVPGSHHGPGRPGSELLNATRERGLEGIVAKRLQSPYEPGRRTRTWLKIKHKRRQELVIGGWLPGVGRRAGRIGALLVGYRQDGELRYAGRVGTGFTDAALQDLRRRLEPLRRPISPFTVAPRLPREAVFVEPRLIAEVEFREWTAEGVMRAASYRGLRGDGSPPELPAGRDRHPRRPHKGLRGDGSPPEMDPHGQRSEREPRAQRADPEALFDEVRRLADGSLAVLVEGRRLKLTNWDKVLYPATGFTKGDLITYYARIAPALLPHLRDRPLTVKRCPEGVEGESFFEKNSPSHRPVWVQTARVGGIEYTLAQDRPTLIWLANLAAIELHTPLSLHTAPEHPTMVVFDLDPGPPAGIIECCEVALVVRGLFEQLGLESFAKASGSKGLQVYVPVDPQRTTYAHAKRFARRIAELLEQRMPELVVARMSRRVRAGRVLVDWSQNDAHKTTVAVYSARARARPTVSAPVTWEEVGTCLRERDPAWLRFETEAVLARVTERGDLFAPVISLRQRLAPT